MKEGDAVGAISVYVLPVFLLSVFMMAFVNKTNAFDHFVEGAKRGDENDSISCSEYCWND